MSNHYNQTRAEYYRQLERASQSGGDIAPFLVYALQGFVDGLRAQIDQIRVQQWDVSWQNYVHDVFREKISSGDLRRRQLLLDLSAKPEGVRRGDLVRLSPEVASLYARKTPKTLSRDVNALIGMGLMEEREDGNCRAKRETILAFLPLRRQPPVEAGVARLADAGPAKARTGGAPPKSTAGLPAGCGKPRRRAVRTSGRRTDSR